MALPAGFLDELRARTPLAGLIGRRTRLVRSGRNWKACCPFHGEKSPSFYVYDDHFHCFGCGVHGDAISFVMQSDGVGFPEAVERLAGEAGMEVPRASPEAEAAERRRLGLAEALEAAAIEFRRRLAAPEGEAARAYLARRGLDPATIEAFGLGYSGDGRGGLINALSGQGFSRETLLEAGLLRAVEGEAARELFYNRVMFPIRDRRGRVISFGGRLLGPGQPKYVNGPESPVFAKRRSLYGQERVRAGVQAGAALVVVEGYMDVIALHRAGFAGALAPLGTSLTEEQLALLWEIAPNPVLCFDGDGAGLRAAARAAMLALPLLRPEHSLSIATLPAGEDPDTLIVKDGRGGFQAVLDAARPLAEALFDLLREPASERTPEGRAAFLARLEAAAASIRDRALAGEYRHALRERYYAATRPARSGSGRPGSARPGSARPGSGRSSSGWQDGGRSGRAAPLPPILPPRPHPGAGSIAAERARILTAILLRHPALLGELADAYAGLDLPAPLARLRATMLEFADHAPLASERPDGRLDSDALMSHLSLSGLDDVVRQVLAVDPVPLPGCAAASAMLAEAASGWWHIFGLMHRHRLQQEVMAARDEFAAQPDAARERRLIALSRALAALNGAEPEDAAGAEATGSKPAGVVSAASDPAGPNAAGPNTAGGDAAGAPDRAADDGTGPAAQAAPADKA